MPHQLILCGAGLSERQATVESLEALTPCERVLLWHVPEEAATGLLGRLRQAQDLTPALRAGGDEAGIAAVSKELARGARVGVVFGGHPLLYTPAAALIRRCRAEKRPYLVVSGVSSPDGTMTLVESLLGDGELELFSHGFNVRDAADAASGRAALDARYSTIVLKAGGLAGAKAAALAKALSSVHGSKAEVFLAREGGPRRSCERIALSKLAGALAKADSAVTLFVPARLPEAG